MFSAIQLIQRMQRPLLPYRCHIGKRIARTPNHDIFLVMSTTSVPESVNITVRPEPQDLGFGSVVGRANEKRLLNRDGSFNPRRRGLPFVRSLSAYHHLLTMSWPKFLSLVAASYFVVNAIFAGIYVACGPGALEGPAPVGTTNPFIRAFFFSVDTLATIGYGNGSP